MEQLGLSEEDWTFIKDNIGAFCSKSDEECRTVLEAEGRPVTQEEVDKLVEEMYEDEFDEMCRNIILEVLEQFGYEIKEKPKKKEKKKKTEEEKESDSDSDSDSDGDSDEDGKEVEKEEEVEVESH